MRVLLTGAGGQLGQALEAALARHEVVALGRAALDVAKLDAVREAVAAARPDFVINAAAYTDVDGAEQRPDLAIAANALGPRNLAVETARRSIPILHVSSDYVFSGSATRPYHEYDPPGPRSAYGWSKLAGEEAVRTLNPRHHIVRTAWLYDAGGRNFPNTMRALAAARQEVRVVSDQYGSPTFAPHLAAAIDTLLESGGAYGIHHLAGAGSASWYELAVDLFRSLGLTTRVTPISTADFPRAAERPRYSVLTSVQEPRITLPPWQDGLAEYAARVR